MRGCTKQMRYGASPLPAEAAAEPCTSLLCVNSCGWARGDQSLARSSVYIQAPSLDSKPTWMHTHPQALPWPDSSKCRASLLSTASRGCRRSVTGTCQRRLYRSCLSTVNYPGKKSCVHCRNLSPSFDKTERSRSEQDMPAWRLACKSAPSLLDFKTAQTGQKDVTGAVQGLYDWMAGSMTSCMFSHLHSVLLGMLAQKGS